MATVILRTYVHCLSYYCGRDGKGANFR